MVSTKELEIIQTEDLLFYLDALISKLEVVVSNPESKSSELCKVMVFAQRQLIHTIWDYIESKTETLDDLIERVGEA